jgi:hypothetical protein
MIKLTKKHHQEAEAARSEAYALIHGAIQKYFEKKQNEDSQGSAGTAIVGVQMALMEAAARLQFMGSVFGLPDETPDEIVEMSFAEAARTIIKNVLEERKGLKRKGQGPGV